MKYNQSFFDGELQLVILPTEVNFKSSILQTNNSACFLFKQFVADKIYIFAANRRNALKLCNLRFSRPGFANNTIIPGEQKEKKLNANRFIFVREHLV
jgi:hypothetical protein